MGKWISEVAPTVGRVFFLALLAGLSLALLTAAQISTAFLAASGVTDGVSAVAIQSSAKRYEQNRRNVDSLLNTIQQTRDNRLTGVEIAANATIHDYVQTVAFRRFVFGCYPSAYAAVKDSPAFKGKESIELSWAFTSELYLSAKSAQAAVGCDLTPMNLDQLLSALSPGGSSPAQTAPQSGEAAVGAGARDLTVRTPSLAELPADGAIVASAKLYPVCAKAMPVEQLDCLWTNVTVAVGLGAAVNRQLAGLQAAQDARSTALGALNADLGSDPALGDARGRTAVGAWCQLSRICDEQEETANQELPAGRRKFAEFLLAPLNALGDLAGALVAALVVLPVLAQSAAMSMSAGALGGGVGHMWDRLGYGAFGHARLGRTQVELIRLQTQLNLVDPDKPGDVDGLKAGVDDLTSKIAAIQATNTDQPAPGAMMTAAFLGSAAALVVWLLTTAGLFVISGGSDTASASPNVLLAFALIAGLARERVIERVFETANKAVSSD